MKSEEWIESVNNNYVPILAVLNTIAGALREVHSKGYSYKVLRPMSVSFIDSELKRSHIKLKSPAYVWPHENVEFI
jgi:hypothetical protein